MLDAISAPPEQFAKVGALDICYQSFGDQAAPPILMIMGLGAQMIVWEDDFCEALARRGYRVIRFDNRDIGRSSKIDSPPIDVVKAIMSRKPGERLEAPYLLRDMAADAVGLLDSLGLTSANIVGASMGGMIAQEMAIHWPDRVRSLTSIMSTTGDPNLPPPNPQAAAVLMAPTPGTREGFIESNANAWRVLRGPGFPADEARDYVRATRAFERGLSPDGAARQLLAIYASGSRKKTLPTVTAPTLVIHGADDPLVPLAAGEDTARSVPGARLVVVPRMGHAMPIEMWQQIIDEINAISR